MISTSSPFFSSFNKGMWRRVDFRADAPVADIGMDRIGKIDGVRATGHCDQAALRRKAEHLVEEQLKLRVLQKFLWVIALKEIVDELASH